MEYQRTETVVLDFSGEAGEAAFRELMECYKKPRAGVEIRLLARGNEVARLEKLLEENEIEY